MTPTLGEQTYRDVGLTGVSWHSGVLNEIDFQTIISLDLV